MAPSAKKKREKKADFVKPKLKVGKARPKNTNATNTSFTAKSIVLKQQNLATAETQDAVSLFQHHLKLLSSKAESQRKDSLIWLTSASSKADGEPLPVEVSAIVAKAQSLILDGNPGVRNQTLKLLKALPAAELGSVDELALYTRAGMAHLSADIKTFSLDVLDWLLSSQGEKALAFAGGWVKMLRTFQNLLGWQGKEKDNAAKWTTAKTSSDKLGTNKLLVHQLTTLANFLHVGLKSPLADPEAERKLAAAWFPVHQAHVHMLPQRSNPYGYLNLFGATRDVEGEVYDDSDERSRVFSELGFLEAFQDGAREAKKEGGEVGRAASAVEKALRLADAG